MAVKQELSRLFELGELGTESVPFEITAEADERRAVARRLELIELAALRAAGAVEAAGRGTVRVRGHLEAELVQRCVVTLEPVTNRVEAAFDRLFVRGAATGSQVSVDPDAPDIEPLLDDMLDLGELVVEELALAMDPYPRAADADEFLTRYASVGADGGATGDSPFAALLAGLPKQD